MSEPPIPGFEALDLADFLEVSLRCGATITHFAFDGIHMRVHHGCMATAAKGSMRGFDYWPAELARRVELQIQNLPFPRKTVTVAGFEVNFDIEQRVDFVTTSSFKLLVDDSEPDWFPFLDLGDRMAIFSSILDAKALRSARSLLGSSNAGSARL